MRGSEPDVAGVPFERTCGHAPCSASVTRRRFLGGATGQPASIRQKTAAEPSGSEGNRIVCPLEAKRERMVGLGPGACRCGTLSHRAAESGRRQSISSVAAGRCKPYGLTFCGKNAAVRSRRPGGAVPPPRVAPLAKATRSKSWRGAAGVTGGRTVGKGWRSGEAVKKGSARRSRRQAKKAPAVVAGGCRQEVFLPDRPALVRKLW